MLLIKLIINGFAYLMQILSTLIYPELLSIYSLEILSKPLLQIHIFMASKKIY